MTINLLASLIIQFIRAHEYIIMNTTVADSVTFRCPY